jgi:hypothetical protein
MADKDTSLTSASDLEEFDKELERLEKKEAELEQFDEYDYDDYNDEDYVEEDHRICVRCGHYAQLHLDEDGCFNGPCTWEEMKFTIGSTYVSCLCRQFAETNFEYLRQERERGF